MNNCTAFHIFQWKDRGVPEQDHATRGKLQCSFEYRKLYFFGCNNLCTNLLESITVSSLTRLKQLTMLVSSSYFLLKYNRFCIIQPRLRCPELTTLSIFTHIDFINIYKEEKLKARIQSKLKEELKQVHLWGFPWLKKANKNPEIITGSCLLKTTMFLKDTTCLSPWNNVKVDLFHLTAKETVMVL